MSSSSKSHKKRPDSSPAENEGSAAKSAKVVVENGEGIESDVRAPLNNNKFLEDQVKRVTEKGEKMSDVLKDIQKVIKSYSYQKLRT